MFEDLQCSTVMPLKCYYALIPIDDDSDLFCHDYVSKENALQAFKLIICGWCCKGPPVTDVGAVTWVQLLGRRKD